ncbi:MAG: hypothetical protein H0W30_09130 [Gemmatimonadaceae bacterium]|nr:hypothetical protein [Gemmatimonadaceae bacterium]MDQ3517171.1 hypothetical protein [Gemmatimonadota bacterium]
MKDRPSPVDAFHRALDEVRFGAARTLNLRVGLPTTIDARTRANAWLRQQQASNAGEVLLITGRGRGSIDGIAAVRAEIVKLLSSLQRQGVVDGVHEHTAGSFVVQMAPFRATHAARLRKSAKLPPPPADAASLRGLGEETRVLLRQLAARALSDLGVRDPAPFMEGEMLNQFALAAARAGEGAGREVRLHDEISSALSADHE